MALLVDGLEVKLVPVDRNRPADYRFALDLEDGSHEVAAGFLKGRRGARNRFLTMIGSLGSLCPRGLPILLTTIPSMSSPKSSPRGKFSPLHGIPGFRANLPRLESPAGVPGSPVTVRREHQRSSHVAGLVTVVFSFSLPVLPFRRELGLVASAFVRPIRVGTTFYPF